MDKTILLDWAVSPWLFGYKVFGMILQNTVIQQSCYTLMLLQNHATYTTTTNTNECMQSNWVRNSYHVKHKQYIFGS